MTKLEFDRHFDVVPGRVEPVSPLVRRILCNNPSPFTFKGTSTFIVGHGEVAIIDPGPLDDAHFEALIAAVRGETVSHILVTHSHADHSALAEKLKAATGAKTYAFGAVEVASGAGRRLDAGIDHGFAPDVRLNHGNVIERPGWTIEAVFTPGHMSNHMSFALRQEKILFVGDHVMAWATSVVAPPDGSMGQYMNSLHLLTLRDDQLYLPSHGPARPDPKPLVRAYLAHRKMREAAILNRLRAGDRSINEIVAAIYTDVDPRLHYAAALSTRAHLDHLIERGVVNMDEDKYVAL